MAAARERRIALYAYNTRADAEANTNGTEYTSGIVDDTPRFEHVFFTEFPGFGETNAAMFSCDIAGTMNLTDKWIRVKYSYYATDAAATMTDKWLFLGRVDSCKYDNLKTVRTLVAYDLLYYLRSVDVSDWWSTYWADKPAIYYTFGTVFRDMCSAYSVVTSIHWLTLSTPTIHTDGAKATQLSGCSFADMLAFAGQLMGAYFYIDGAGVLRYAYIDNTETPAAVDDNMDTANTEIGDTALPAYAAMMAYSGADVIYSAGTGEPVYTIRDNPLLNGKTTSQIATQLDALRTRLAKVSGFWPLTLECIVSAPDVIDTNQDRARLLTTADGNNTRLHALGSVELWGLQLINQRAVCPADMVTGAAVSASMQAALNDLHALGVEMTFKVNADNVIEAVNLEAQGGVTINAQAININGVVSANGNFKVDTDGNMEAASGKFSGDIVSGNFTANGKVRIVPDYTEQTAGQYAIELIDPTTGYATQLNPDHANIGVDPNTGVGVHLSRTDVTLSSGTNETAANYTRVRMENAGAGATGLRISEGGIGTSGYKDIYIAPGEITRTGQTDIVRIKGSHVEAFEYSASQNKTWYSDFSDVTLKFGSGSGDLRNGNPGVYSTILSDTALTIGNKDILRTHQSLIGMWGTQITANANMNTVALCAVGRYYCPSNATAATLSNCPTSRAFTATVENMLGDVLSLSGNWQQFIRKLCDIVGDEFVQQIATDGSGNVVYGAWRKVLYSAVEKNSYSNTNVKRGECIARRQGNVVSINCAGDAVSIPAATVTDYVTVASKYAPSEIMYVNLANNPAQGKFAIISPNGKVQLYSASAITSAQNFAFSVTYIVD